MAGLVERVPDPDDGRGVLVQLTKAGVKLVDELAPLHLQNEARMLEALSERERDQLARLLEKLLATYEGRSL